ARRSLDGRPDGQEPDGQAHAELLVPLARRRRADGRAIPRRDPNRLAGSTGTFLMPDVAAAYSGEPIIQPSSVGGEWLERAALAAMTPADLVQRCVAIRDLLMQHAE